MRLKIWALLVVCAPYACGGKSALVSSEDTVDSDEAQRRRLDSTVSSFFEQFAKFQTVNHRLPHFDEASSFSMVHGALGYYLEIPGGARFGLMDKWGPGCLLADYGVTLGQAQPATSPRQVPREACNELWSITFASTNSVESRTDGDARIQRILTQLDTLNH